MNISVETDHDLDEIVPLYDSVGWTAYTREPGSLAAALAGSHVVLTARDGPRLVGLARTLSDNVTVCYVQDLLVHPDFRRHGLGRALLDDLLVRYRHCRQFVLSTDLDDVAAHSFYRAVGLVPYPEAGTSGFIRPTD